MRLKCRLSSCPHSQLQVSIGVCVCASFQGKQRALTFSAQICPKTDLVLEIQKTKNQHPRDTLCVNFQTKRTALTFLAQIFPKRALGLKIEKTNVRIRINILKILCPSRHTTSFQCLEDVYTTSTTSYRRFIDVETTLCVFRGVPIFSRKGQL